jgi:hypothetical protein
MRISLDGSATKRPRCQGRRVRWGPASIAALAMAIAGAHAGCDPPPRACADDLASYCEDRSCASYAETVASPCFGCGFGESYGTFSCGGYQVVACGNTDVGSLQYYTQSGELVAVGLGGGASGNTPTSCAWGPASFDLPSCAQSWSSVAGGGADVCRVADVPDAGAPAPDSGAGPLDAGTD